MSDSTIRASLKALMETVPGIGVVHDYDRWVNDSAALVSLFKTDPADKTAPLHGWELTRDAVPQVARLAGDSYRVTHSYAIRGYYALKDSVASERLFNLVVDAVLQKFLDARLPDTEGRSLPTVTKLVPWVFAGVLCHHAELRISVTEIVEMTPEQSGALINIYLTAYLAPDEEAQAEAEITV